MMWGMRRLGAHQDAAGSNPIHVAPITSPRPDQPRNLKRVKTAGGGAEKLWLPSIP